MRVSEHGGGPTQAVLALSRDPNLELPPGIGLPLLPVAMARSPPRPPLLPSLARAAGGVPPLPPLADPSMVADGGAMGGPCELGPRPQPHPQQQLLHGTACGAAPAEKAAAVDDCAKNPDELLRHANPAAAGGGVGLDRGAPVQGPAGSVLGSGSARAPPAGSLLAAQLAGPSGEVVGLLGPGNPAACQGCMTSSAVAPSGAGGADAVAAGISPPRNVAPQPAMEAAGTNDVLAAHVSVPSAPKLAPQPAAPPAAVPAGGPAADPGRGPAAGASRSGSAQEQRGAAAGPPGTPRVALGVAGGPCAAASALCPNVNGFCGAPPPIDAAENASEPLTRLQAADDGDAGGAGGPAGAGGPSGTPPQHALQEGACDLGPLPAEEGNPSCGTLGHGHGDLVHVPDTAREWAPGQQGEGNPDPGPTGRGQACHCCAEVCEGLHAERGEEDHTPNPDPLGDWRACKRRAAECDDLQGGAAKRARSTALRCAEAAMLRWQTLHSPSPPKTPALVCVWHASERGLTHRSHRTICTRCSMNTTLFKPAMFIYNARVCTGTCCPRRGKKRREHLITRVGGCSRGDAAVSTSTDERSMLGSRPGSPDGQPGATVHSG